MSGINASRVLAGGVLAGLVFVAGGLASAAVFGSHMKFELRPMGMTEIFARHLGVRMVFGLVVAFLYAATRPRLGPGPSTAVVSGIVVWLLAYVTLLNAFDELGVVGGPWLWLAGAWGIAEAVLAAFVAAAVYAEP